MSMLYQIFLCVYVSLVTDEKDLYENTVTTAASHFKNFEEVAKKNLTLPKSLPSSKSLSKPSIRYGTHSVTIEIDNETVFSENYTYPKSSIHVVKTPRLHFPYENNTYILTSDPSTENEKIFKANGGYRETIISDQGQINTVVDSISTSGKKIVSVVKTPHYTYYRYENNTHIITSDPSSENGTVISLPTEYDNKKTFKINGGYRETVISGQGQINNVIGSVSTSGNKIVFVVKTPHGFNYRYENNTHIIASDPSSEKGKATFKGNGGYRETIISGKGQINNVIGSILTSGNKIVSVVKTPHGTYYAYENDTHIITSDSEPSLENTAIILFQKSYIILIFVFFNYIF